MATAITLALAVLAGSVAYLVVAAWAVGSGVSVVWFVLGVPAAVLAVPVLLNTVWFTVSRLFGSRPPPDARIGIFGTARCYAREVLVIAGSIPRMILYRWLLPDPAPAPAANPVLLLHGVLCNAGVWQTMRRTLAARGIGPVYALSYGPPLASIERFADQMAERIDTILAATGARQVIVVAHSMGGLVARAYLRRYGGAKLRRLVTIGTPHHGSVLAYTFFGRSLAQMRPLSRWLMELNAAQVDTCPPIVSLWSWQDSMVVPQTSSLLPGAQNVALVGIAHNTLLRDAQVQERVAAEIERGALD